METKDLTIHRTYDLAKPAEAVEMATVLKGMIVKQKLFSNIKGKNYAHVDAWQMAGFLTGLSAIVEEPKNLSTDKEIKWSCTAKIFHGDKLVATGYALCSSKESTKKSFDEYAILSMAQTRALGKAYRNKIGFIIKLAGYESTPSEEMRKVDEVVVEPKNADDQVVPPQFECHGCGNPMTKQEREFSIKMFKKALCRSCQKELKKK